MPQWLVLIVIGIIIYGVTYAPVFPADWAKFAQFIGGVLILVGFLLLLLTLLGIVHGPVFGTR